MFKDTLPTAFGAQLHIVPSSLTNAIPARRFAEAGSLSGHRRCVQLQVDAAMLDGTESLAGGFARLGCLRGTFSRIGFALAHAPGHLAMAVYDLGTPEAKAMVRSALAEGYLHLDLRHQDRRSLLRLRVTERMRAVLDESLGAPPCSVAEFTEGLAGLTRELRETAMYWQLDVDPLRLQSIHLSVCLPVASDAPDIELTRLIDIH
ncbi:MAG: hypothetical protein U1F53_20755 [Burkholderiaceae bacterium]